MENNNYLNINYIEDEGEALRNRLPRAGFKPAQSCCDQKSLVVSILRVIPFAKNRHGSKNAKIG
jgi:hypothetical protein